MYRLFLSLLLSAFACISVFAVPMEAIQAKISNNNKINSIKINNNLDYHNNIILLKTKKMQNIDKNNNVILSDKLSNKIESLGVVINNVRSPFAKYYYNNGVQLESSNYGIERICEISIEPNNDIYKICQELMKDESVEYAEPAPIRQYFDFVPNDPSISSQWHLKNINIYEAWEIVKDKTGVLLGIVDSGTDIDHVDLIDNIWTNPNEIEDKKDNDDNGKIDDIHGWDFVGNITTNDISYGRWKEDNNPSTHSDNNQHGTHVAGCAAAVTNNKIGVAGTGMNCKIVASKHAVDSRTDYGIFRGYEGILYLAKLGAKIINCSWGGNAYGETEHDVLREAVALGSIILVAAGNESRDIDIHPLYPASYEECIAIGATSTNNKAADFSNYGYKTVVFAPGYNIYATLPNNKYGALSGTSMATPVAAGVAGLVMSVFPEYTSKQLEHQLRSTGDNIVSTDQYKVFKKINAYNAVTYNNPDYPDKVVPGISVSNINLPPFDKLVNYSKKELTLTLKNYIGKANDLVVEISSLDGYVVSSKFEQSFELGSMDINEEKTISLDIQVDSLCGISDGKAKLLIEYGDGEFYDFEVIYIPINISTDNKYVLTNVYGADESSQVYYSFHNYNDGVAFAVGGIFSGNTLASPILQVIPDNVTYSSMKTFKTPQSSIPYVVHALTTNKLLIASATSRGKSFLTYTTDRLSNNIQYIETTKLTPFINYITFFDSNNGIILGDPNSSNYWGIAISSNGGKEWKTLNTSIPAEANETGLINVATKLDTNVWFGTTKGKVIKINRGGSVWTLDTVCMNSIIMSLGFANENRGAAIYVDLKDNNYYLATYDGKKWSKGVFDFSKITTSNIPQYIYGTSTGMFIVVFDNNAVYSSKDFGRNWSRLPNKELYDAKYITTIPQDDSKKIKLASYGLSVQNNSLKEKHFCPYYVREISTISLPFAAKHTVKLTPENKLYFDKIELGKDSVQSIKIENTGNRTFVIGDVRIVPANSETSDLDFSVKKYDNSISVYSSGSMEISFSPKTAGEKIAYLYIANNSETEEIVYELSGNGVFIEFSELQASKTELRWDYTENSEESNFFNEFSISLTNIGNIPLNITNCEIVPILNGTNPKDFTVDIVNKLPVEIGTKEVVKMNVSISLQDTITYAREASLVLYNTGKQPEYKISLVVIGDEVYHGSVVFIENSEVFSYPYPNPCKNNIKTSVLLMEPEYYSIDLYDISGNKINTVYTGYGIVGSNEININFENIAAGNYYLLLNLGDKHYLNKITKQ